MNQFEHERLDVYQGVLVLADEASSQSGRGLLLRVVAMLTAMVVKISGSGSGSGSSTAQPIKTSVAEY